MTLAEPDTRPEVQAQPALPGFVKCEACGAGVLPRNLIAHRASATCMLWRLEREAKARGLVRARRRLGRAVLDARAAQVVVDVPSRAQLAGTRWRLRRALSVRHINDRRVLRREPCEVWPYRPVAYVPAWMEVVTTDVLPSWRRARAAGQQARREALARLATEPGLAQVLSDLWQSVERDAFCARARQMLGLAGGAP